MAKKIISIEQKWKMFTFYISTKNRLVPKKIELTQKRLIKLLSKKKHIDSKFRIGYSSTGERFIECLTCHRKSYNENDIKERYCGYCHKFHIL